MNTASFLPTLRPDKLLKLADKVLGQAKTLRATFNVPDRSNMVPEYDDDVPNETSQRALEQLRSDHLTTYESIEDFRKHLGSL